ncbi:hypothetical protein ELH16_08575 [Rhizobium ruizarguesonis]|uniref:hypothetical protein n=1 Tax=Rhizobium ruizarguesonis TaxID=2081791 RepID=UPI001030B30B|nr:hypothetical protein [Rhizobium ruizarguesonis]TBD68309.1 hypothetical protein ELH16_08575 [Rhizobium ruizarguesonis]
MACSYGCFDEAEQLDEVSPGPVRDEEVLCRSAFGKKAHYNNSGPKAGFINNKDLLAGTLSVWRRLDGTPQEMDDIREQLFPPEGNALWDVFGAKAGDIRSIRASNEPTLQALHAYDDCRTDNSGGKHRKHAVLAICQAFSPSSLSKDDSIYVEIRDALFRMLLKSSPQWSLPDGERTASVSQ